MWLAIIATVSLVVGLIWLGWALWQNWKSSQVKTWQRADATILQAAAEVVEVGQNTLVDPQSIPVANNNNRYRARVAYRYNVMGRQAVSENFMYGKEFFTAQEIRTLMAPVRQGQTVSILYNPDNFDEAYIYDNAATNWTGIWWGIGLILLGLILFAFNKKNKRKNFYNDTSIQLSDSPRQLQKQRQRIDDASLEIKRDIGKKEQQLNFLEQQQMLIRRQLDRLLS